MIAYLFAALLTTPVSIEPTLVCQTASEWKVEEINSLSLEDSKIRQTYSNGEAYVEIEPHSGTFDYSGGDMPLFMLSAATKFDIEPGKYRLRAKVRTGPSPNGRFNITTFGSPRVTAGGRDWRQSLNKNASNVVDVVLDNPQQGLELGVLFSAKVKTWLWIGPVEICKIGRH